MATDRTLSDHSLGHTIAVTYQATVDDVKQELDLDLGIAGLQISARQDAAADVVGRDTNEVSATTVTTAHSYVVLTNHSSITFHLLFQSELQQTS